MKPTPIDQRPKWRCTAARGGRLADRALREAAASALARIGSPEALAC